MPIIMYFIVKKRQLSVSVVLLLTVLLLYHPTYAKDITIHEKNGTTTQILMPSYNGFRMAMDKNTGKFGYVDEEGNRLIHFIYDGSFALNEEFCSENFIGLAYTESGTTREYYTIDTKGNILGFDKSLGTISFFNGIFGISNVSTNDPENPEKSALFDAKGTLITECNYYINHGSQTSYCYGNIILAEKNGKRGTLNEYGKIIIPIEYESIQNQPENQEILSVVKKVNDTYKQGYIKSNGEVLFDCKYDSAAEFEERYGRLELDSKWAVVDTNGNFVTDFIFDELFAFREGVARVRIDDKMGCIDTNGNIIIPVQYHDIGISEYGNINAVMSDETTEVKLASPLIEKRNINIYVNDKWIYTDQEAFIEDGRTLAPIRTISEALGYYVNYNDKTRVATIQNAEKIIHLTIDSKAALVNTFDDEIAPETVLLDVPAKIINSRTFVPVRFIAEAIGADVQWNPDSRTVYISCDIKNDDPFSIKPKPHRT